MVVLTECLNIFFLVTDVMEEKENLTSLHLKGFSPTTTPVQYH